jgi:uncharacterized protein (DUF952 family)
MIYKIFTPRQWDDLQQAGTFLGSPADLADGFIHFSYEDQTDATLAKHYANEPDCVIAAIDPGRLGGRLIAEASRGGALFPHLYDAPIPLAAISAHWSRQEWENLKS